MLRYEQKKQGQRRRRARCLDIEVLEVRTVPTGTLSGLALQAPDHSTLDQALNLGDLTRSGHINVSDSIGHGESTDAGVNWYSFTLDRAGVVTLTTQAGLSDRPLPAVLSLYTSVSPDWRDPFDPYGFHLVAQDDGASHGGNAQLVRPLSPGVTYYVGVSGSGNRFFQPFIADSGYPGATGDYSLNLDVSDLGSGIGQPPVVLATDPAPNTALDSSPFVIRVDLSGPLQIGSFDPTHDVHLTYSASGSLNGVSDQVVGFSNVYFNQATNELLLTPDAPLPRGAYRLSVHLSGQDFSTNFSVQGIEGIAGATSPDDTPSHAHQLGDITSEGLIQVVGGIGDDPTDRIPFDPADMDLYHFHVSGAGRYSLQTEVFAGRIGSALDPGLSLFRLDPTDGQLELVAFNESTLNQTRTHDGRFAPLYLDPAFTAGLVEGDYFLAVSGNGNVPDPPLGLLPGTNGVFNPAVSHSGRNGFSIGSYVLNLLVTANNVPPAVQSISLADGSTLASGEVLNAPPPEFVVQFSEPVNLAQLYLQSFIDTGHNQTDAAYIQSQDGTVHPLRLHSVSADGTTYSFILFDALPNGACRFVFSGVTDLAGNPLVGAGTGNRYVVPFSVQSPPRGDNGNPLRRSNTEPNNNLSQAQNLGTLFRDELLHEVIVHRDARSNASDQGDYFQFTVWQRGQYEFLLSDAGSPAGLQLSVATTAGNVLASSGNNLGSGTALFVVLDPGTYVVSVTGWSSAQAASIQYQLALATGQSFEAPPPLTIGASPAIRLQLTPIGPTGNSPTLATSNQSASGGVVLAGVLVQGAGSSGNSQNAASVPGDVLLALAISPMSGTDEKLPADPAPANEVYERILARAPVLMPSEIFVELPILVHPPDSSAIQDRPLSPLIGAIRSLNKLDWRQAVDLLHRLELDKLDSSSSPKDSDLETSEPDPKAAKDGSTELSSLGDTVPSGARALAAAAAMFLLGSDRLHERRCKDSMSKSKGLERREFTAND
jgi:hypothetical protein